MKKYNPLQPLFLKTPIEKLKIAPEVKEFMKKHEFTNLQELLKLKGKELLEMDGYSYRMLQELLSFLNEHNSLDLFIDS